MGSMLTEPDDLSAFFSGGGGEAGRTLKNITKICASAHRIHSTGVFTGVNPLEFSVPLLLLQVSGFVLSSSGLGQWKAFRETIFPSRGFVLLDVMSSIGGIFYFFLIGVQTDMMIVKKIDTRAFGIGYCAVIVPLVLTVLFSVALANAFDSKTSKTILLVGGVESFINFPMVASLLSELHLINSEFGRIALSSSMVSGISTMCIILIGSMLDPIKRTTYDRLFVKSVSWVIAIGLVLCSRYVIMWMAKKNPVGQPLKEGFVVTLLLGVFVSAFCSQSLGAHSYFGALVLGIIIPPGPPIGPALMERLESITSWMFMPIFFFKTSLVVNMQSIKLKKLLGLSFIIFVSAFGKFLGVLVMSLFNKMPMRDAVSLSLIMNSQGAFELGMFKMLKKDKKIDNESFGIMCTGVMVLVGIITPIIRYLFDPSKRYVVYRRRTVMHSRSESDLRVLVCVHDQEDVPNAINLLEALNPTRRSHLIVYMLHFVELFGRANPQLISQKFSRGRSSRFGPSESIINAFKYFGQSNREIVTIYPFTAISPPASMHDDVYSLALDKSTSLILVPFHKRFHSNGVLSLSKNNLKLVNNHILDKAPCSVAIVVNRGNSNTLRSISTDLYCFQVALVFLGGPDDREALFIGARMSGHPNINLTVIRLSENGNVASDDMEERRLDCEAVIAFQGVMVDNYRVRFIEEVVKDGNGTVSVLRSMGNHFDLVMVGRRHNPYSVLVQGLVLWNERTELGEIGEVLSSSDFMENATILVVQQHTNMVHEETLVLRDSNTLA
ncbi:cation/H(+) antiporter 15-like [Cucumis melo var. makuwa]|uniref:Cation/H(+) antiporter 15-like n=1 Tax=Cucumis melo var. makuwa TaxID=1194695 RepID=A0A5D3DQ15_CUCMM|nr:cation/H(+) antiporter 15-like [Cucumis melo var. makuwa]